MEAVAANGSGPAPGGAVRRARSPVRRSSEETLATVGS
jgi:hypothetical protein